MQSVGPIPFRLEEGDVVAASRTFMRRRMMRPPMLYLLVAIIVLAVLLFGLDILDGALSSATVAVLIAVPCAFAIVFVVLAPRMARRQFRQSAALRDPQQIAFDAESITFSGERGQVRIPLAELHAYADTETLVMLLPTEAMFHALPKRDLGDAATALLAALERSGVTRW